MYKIMIYINTHSGDKWFYYQENGKDYVAYSLQEIKETVLTLIDTYGKDNIKIVKQVTGEDMEGSVETFIYDSTDNYEELVNRPSINGVEIIGELSLAELGIQPAGDYATNERVNTLEETVNNIDFSPYATNERVNQVEYKVDNIDLTPYATNERVDQVEAKVDAIDLEPYATMDYLDEVVAGIDFSASNENITGVKTFSVLPRSTVEPTSEDELTNKSYVDHGVEGCASKEYVAQYVDDSISQVDATYYWNGEYTGNEEMLQEIYDKIVNGKYVVVQCSQSISCDIYETPSNNTYMPIKCKPTFVGATYDMGGVYKYCLMSIPVEATSNIKAGKRVEKSYLLRVRINFIVSDNVVTDITINSVSEYSPPGRLIPIPLTEVNKGSYTKSYCVLDTKNQIAYTPSSDYNPATKKYVDDAISSAITTTLEGEY